MASDTQAAPDVSGRSWARRYVEWSSRLLRRVELKGWAGLAWPLVGSPGSPKRTRVHRDPSMCKAGEGESLGVSVL